MLPPSSRQTPNLVVLDYEHEGDTISWSNWRARKELGLYFVLGLFLLVWGPVTLVLTILSWLQVLPFGVALVFVPFFWLGLLAVATAFGRLLAHETICVRDDALLLTIVWFGFRRTRKVRRCELQCVAFESHDDESVRTLNLLLNRGRGSSRIILAYSLAQSQKTAVYSWLEDRLQCRGWECEFRTDKRLGKAM